MSIYYAAHKEGVFDSVDSALRKAALSTDQIAWAKTNAIINGDESVWHPVNNDFGALVTPSDGRFILWRGYYGSDWRGSREDALRIIQMFRDHGDTGDWAIIEYVPLDRSYKN